MEISKYQAKNTCKLCCVVWGRKKKAKSLLMKFCLSSKRTTGFIEYFGLKKEKKEKDFLPKTIQGSSQYGLGLGDSLHRQAHLHGKYWNIRLCYSTQLKRTSEMALTAWMIIMADWNPVCSLPRSKACSCCAIWDETWQRSCDLRSIFSFQVSESEEFCYPKTPSRSQLWLVHFWN